jgi:hypothetical protein
MCRGTGRVKGQAEDRSMTLNSHKQAENNQGLQDLQRAVRVISMALSGFAPRDYCLHEQGCFCFL